MRELASATRAGAVRLPARQPPEHVQRAQRLLDLQQTSGNAAVTRLVQRAPNDRPASTDLADVAAAGPRGDMHARIIGMSIVARVVIRAATSASASMDGEEL